MRGTAKAQCTPCGPALRRLARSRWQRRHNLKKNRWVIPGDTWKYQNAQIENMVNVIASAILVLCYAQVVAPASCQTKTNTWMQCGDVLQHPGQKISSAEQCCNLCIRTAGCTHWVYGPLDGKPNCRIKSGDSTCASPKPGQTSGVVGPIVEMKCLHILIVIMRQSWYVHRSRIICVHQPEVFEC